MNIPCSILILTKNEEENLPACLESVTWSDDIHVYDSFSTDSTVEIAKKAGAIVTQRIFDNWSEHQNWGIHNIQFKNTWLLYIDADERVPSNLAEEIQEILSIGYNHSAFQIERRDIFHDRWLKHAQATKNYIRLYRPKKISYERLVNPITHVEGTIGRCRYPFYHYPFSKGMSHWFERHNSYSTLEAAEILKKKNEGWKDFSISKAFFARDFNERRMHQKQLFYRLPARPLLKFFLLYFIKGGFLDGGPGFIYSVLQSIYEYMIVLKVRELSHHRADVDANAATDTKS